MENLPTYLHFVLLIQPLLFAVQLFTYNSMFSKPHRILGVYMVLISFYFFANASFITIPTGIDHEMNIFIVPLFLALNPFYYLYVKALTFPMFRISKLQYLHFIPFIVFFVFSLISYFGHFQPIASSESQAGKVLYEDVLLFIVGIPSIVFAVYIYYAQFTVYLFMIVWMLIQHKSRLGHYFSYKENISLNWLWIFLAIYVVFSLFDGIVYYFDLYENAAELYYVIMILFISFLGFFGIKQSDIYLHKLTFGNNDNAVENSNVEVSEDLNIIVEEKNSIDYKYSGSSLTNDFKESLLSQVKTIMITEKGYRNSNLSINDIAVRLNTNYKYISQVINEIEGVNFYNFVNMYRVEEAKALLTDPESRKLSFEGVANQVGFHSRSAFNNAFKKFTGKTPSEFIKQDVNL